MKDMLVSQAKRLGVVTCRRNEPLKNVVRRMADEDISALVVVEADGSLAGIITRSDVVRAGLTSDSWPEEPVEAYMTANVITVSPDARLAEVMRILLDRHIHRVVVVRQDGGRQVPVAVVSDSDLVCEMADAVA
ncbi:MAG: CBS domain-containing protein [Caldilineales bacterium]|nr:CBS domain-containing protein [Caldilineales bacterium]MDW8317028.1 CBS domain-containing protein [Anaerolineae bacterium]